MTDIHQFTIGQLTCYVINDGDITMGPTSIFFEGASPDDLQSALVEHGLSEDGMTIPCSIMLVDTGEARILVDCGSDGETGGYDAELGQLFDGLKTLNIDTADITHVILTHGHFDHIAACVDKTGQPYFANATYIMAEAEYKDWADNDAQTDNEKLIQFHLHSIKKQLQLVEPDVEILPGVRLIATPGHTYHHTSVEFESDGQFLLCIIDVMDHYLQGQHPTWGANWDVDRQASIESRRKILERATETNALVHGFHFPFPGLGRFQFDGSVWQWERES